VVLEACTSWRTPGGDAPLDGASREAILAAARGLAGRALRVLAVATRKADSLEEAESGMTFLGLVGMLDPPRPEARAAVQTCLRAGIRPVMITGDHPATARAIASEMGILDRGEVVTGVELDARDEAELERDVERIDVFARVSPAHKLRVVAALQARGHIVAMTGDGVNDAPALKKADVGIAMGITGTDVAKESAGMNLTDDNFASIVGAVEEGRAIFDNIKKYLMYLLSSNIGEITLMAGAMMLGLPMPLSAVQILYVNLATDGLPALALAVDPQEPDLMLRSPRRLDRGILTRPIVSLMALGGLWSCLLNLGIFAWALKSGRGQAEAMSMTFVALVLIQFFKAYSFRSERRSILKGPFANRWLNLAILWEVAILLCVLYLPLLQEPFGTYALPARDWLIILPAALTILPVLELAKWLERRGR
jgi:Ca2+-transporting ATPase